MKFPLYRFSDVLRSLRNESGLTVLEAAELTGYGNYERWESGQTKVRPEYLEMLAEVFGVEGDLWLLTYAWLVDRHTPQPDRGFAEFSAHRLSGIAGRLPTRGVDLGEHGALRPMNHGQLAFACLIARYGPSYAGANVPLVLEPTKRIPMPPADRSGYVLARYADVLGDLLRYVARTFLLAGIGQVPQAIALAVFRHTLLLMAEPEPLASLLDASDVPPGVRLRGFDGLSVAAARSAPKLHRLATRELDDLCRLAAAAEGRPVGVDEVKAELRRIAHDDEYWEHVVALGDDQLVSMLERLADEDEWVIGDWPVTRIVADLPEPDPRLMAELQRLRDQLDRRCRRAIREELADATATAEPRAALDASITLQRERLRS